MINMAALRCTLSSLELSFVVRGSQMLTLTHCLDVLWTKIYVSLKKRQLLMGLGNYIIDVFRPGQFAIYVDAQVFSIVYRLQLMPSHVVAMSNFVSLQCLREN